MTEQSGEEVTKAWGYVRLSQEGRETSLEKQKESIRDYATQANLDLVTTRNDGKGTSGFTRDRDEYQLIRDKLSQGELEAIVVRDRARLSRDFDERLWLIQAFRESETELHVVEAGGKVELGNVQQAMFECLHAGMDHIKKMAEIERSRAVVKQRTEENVYQGTPPFGLCFTEDGQHLTRDTEEWEYVERIIAGEGASEAPISAATKHRIANRGVEYYEALLEEYGA